MSKNTLLISPATIKNRTGVAGNIDEKLLYPEIKTAQDMFILPVLGSALFERLQNGIDDNDLTNDEKDLLDNYITDALLYFVLAELPMGLNFQFYTKGVVQKTGENTQQPTMSDLLDVADRYKSRAEFYSERLIKHLRYEVSTNNKFPQYLENYTFEQMKPAQNGYTCSIDLGNGYPRHMTREEKYQGKTGLC
jgi:hypothetical protein